MILEESFERRLKQKMYFKLERRNEQKYAAAVVQVFEKLRWNVNINECKYKHKNTYIRGFPGGASGKEPASQCKRHKRRGFDPWVGKIPRRRAWQPTPVFLPGESHGPRSLVGYSPGSQRVRHV